MDYRYQKILGKITLIIIVSILALSACSGKNNQPTQSASTAEPTEAPTP
ncbi:MAG: hypothetical protein ACD_34C00405G0001, partial [uncultured bacterium]